MLQKIEDAAYLELARGQGTDGHEYAVRSLEWTLEKVNEYWQRFKPFHIFGDEYEESPESFLYLISAMGGLWFDIVDVTDAKVVGVMYLSDIIQAQDRTGIDQAMWHATVWDSKVSPRRNIARAAIANLMKVLQIHRLIAEIPTTSQGAIRVIKNIGFRPEGVLRKAQRFNGQWRDVLLLSLLDEEAAQWESLSK